ncbi:MAG: hypothetical protein GXP25_01230 [Planctomycetes bacterium]|nr:hypothetical protein [Planctomycetota bacterium]
MRRTMTPVAFALALVVALALVGPQAMADEVSLIQAIQKVEAATKMLVVKAATAGSYHQVVAIGGGKTKIFKVDRATGKVEMSREKDWSGKSEKIAAAAKITCSDAAGNAMKECKGELRSVKASLDAKGSVEFIVCVHTKTKGDMRAKVCAYSGKVGAVEPTEGAPTEGCE